MSLNVQISIKIRIGKKIGFWESPNVRNQRPKEQSFEDEEVYALPKRTMHHKITPQNQKKKERELLISYGKVGKRIKKSTFIPTFLS